MDPRAVRAFVNRDREAVDALKRAHWVRRFREGGPVAALDVAHALYEHARRVRPDWPSDAERADDLAHHVELKRLFGMAARVFSRR